MIAKTSKSTGQEEYRVSANLLPPPGAAPRRVITPN
jgi:hypothetical protein